MFDFLKSLEGLKTSIPIAGFFGGVVYVALTKNLTKVQVFTSILIGVLVASYLTPLAVSYVSLYTGMKFTPEMQSGIAFLLGITATSTIPAFIRVLNLYQSK